MIMRTMPDGLAPAGRIPLGGMAWLGTRGPGAAFDNSAVLLGSIWLTKVWAWEEDRHRVTSAHIAT